MNDTKDWNKDDYRWMAIVIDRKTNETTFRFAPSSEPFTNWEDLEEKTNIPPLLGAHEARWCLKDFPQNSCGWHGGVYYCWP
jgi:hypothetical protein